MGLLATVEFDFPTETPVLGIPIDYSEALDEFCQVFDDVSYDLCPVDTGYLRSTISSDHDGELTATCEATAEYAQYQEYGTWCMPAQPYFEPAIAAALDEAMPLFQEELQEALQEEKDLLEEMMEDMEEGDGDDGGIMGGGFFTTLLLAVVIGVIKGIMSGLKEAFSTDEHRSRSGGGSMYDIEIT